MTELNGTVSTRFAPVRDAVEKQLLSGAEVGLSLVVDVDGRQEVDLWGGHRDAARTQPWERDTITNVWSLTKTVTSLAALLLVDAGELDVHAPVARYWPEFAANGKRDVEVRHLLSHTSGLSGLEQPARIEDLYDTRAAAARLAAQAPWWRPGSASGYHLLTYGHLIGELVHRLTGLPLRDFVERHLARPLGADFRIGVGDADLPRVADVVPPAVAFDPSALDPGSVAHRTLTGPPIEAGAANTRAWRTADLGAANGHGNARALARILAPLALEGATPGGRLLGPDTIALVFDRQSAGVDLVNGLPLTWGIGFALASGRTLPWIPEGRIAFWGGWGGSMAIVDLDRRMTITYVMNDMGADILGSARAAAYVRAVYEAMGVASGQG
ncbi:serine hydrolase domain-containing protein [Actinacidiphila guanduensis]|uniref:CubicO group peptidase, beta-lactamase class C family n=1 Tax=Actinacidiphila guanduensis TaxID=310781 RepID=A0A1H0BHW9_9ACTN|nr:serine hydrolase domain-containing protein [Actinacidiphila guanduensis]SDN45212.1 CubicO group peptidase, beta-lactamase class C family [Actinacidiphila guanduensis]